MQLSAIRSAGTLETIRHDTRTMETLMSHVTRMKGSEVSELESFATSDDHREDGPWFNRLLV